MKSIICFAALIAVCLANEIHIRNNCPFTVWPGILGNPGKGNPEGGGFALPHGQTHVLKVANNWAGRIWGRTNCAASGHCQTGDCGKLSFRIKITKLRYEIFMLIFSMNCYCFLVKLDWIEIDQIK